MSGAALAREHHWLRYVVGRALLRENGVAIGVSPHAFELRPEEAGVSGNWVEYFPGNFDQQIAAARESLDITREKRGRVGVFSVGGIADVGSAFSLSLQVIHKPVPTNEAHAELLGLRHATDEIRQRLAVEALVRFDPAVTA